MGGAAPLGVKVVPWSAYPSHILNSLKRVPIGTPSFVRTGSRYFRLVAGRFQQRIRARAKPMAFSERKKRRARLAKSALASLPGEANPKAPTLNRTNELTSVIVTTRGRATIAGQSATSWSSLILCSSRSFALSTRSSSHEQSVLTPAGRAPCTYRSE